MRRIDKKLNIIKANILAESRYLEYKGLLKEDTLADYKIVLQDTGDYPWTKNVGNKEKAAEEEKLNREAAKGFKDEFKKRFGNVSIETTNGIFNFYDIKYRNNHGLYDLIFSNPENKLLFIQFDPRDGYYLNDSVNQTEITSNDSKSKVKEMLKYNKLIAKR